MRQQHDKLRQRQLLWVSWKMRGQSGEELLKLADRGNTRSPSSLPSVSLSVASVYVLVITADKLGGSTVKTYTHIAAFSCSVLL